MATPPNSIKVCIVGICSFLSVAEGRRVGWVVCQGERPIKPYPHDIAKTKVSTTQPGGSSPDLSSGTNVVGRSHPCRFLESCYDSCPSASGPQNPKMAIIVPSLQEKNNKKTFYTAYYLPKEFLLACFIQGIRSLKQYQLQVVITGF